MPNESVNLYLSIQSGSSEQTLVSLTDKTRALDKESQLLKQATDALTKANEPLIEAQKKLQDQVKESAEAIKKWEDAFKESGDELSKMNLEHAREQHAGFKAELTAVNTQIGVNQKTYKEYLETVRKGSLSAGGLGGGGSTASLGQILGGLGIGQQLSALAGQASTSLLQSALGDGAGSIASGALSNAITGASLGTAIAPGIGTAIGAALGGVLGAASSALEELGNKDDAFKAYYGGLYDDVKGRSGEMVGAGSSLASVRESDMKSFSTLLDGDAEAAERFQAALIEIGRTPPFSYDSVAAMSKSMIGLGLSPDDVTDRISALGEAAAALDLGESGVSTIASTLESIQLSGTLESRVLKTLSRQGINVYEALADEFGMPEADIAENLSNLDVNRAISAIYDYMGSHFAGAADGLTDTYSGASGILASYKEDAENAGGAAYNEMRTSGINDEIDAYKGELGDAIKEINAIMGENQARKENLQEQYVREVLDAVLNGNQGSLWSTFSEDQQKTLTDMSQKYASFMEQYQNGDTDAGAELAALYEQAQILGQAYFDNSDEMARLDEVENDLIDAVRDAITPLETAHQRLYDLNQTLSRGLMVKTIKDYYGSTIAEGTGGDIPQLTTVGGHVGVAEPEPDVYYGYNGIPHSHAYGLERVPYDEYPALLHRDERVLTASEARAQDAGQGTAVPIQIPITGNIFTGMPEEIADQIAAIIVRKLEQAATAAAPK